MDNKSNNINIQNAFSELSNHNHTVENSLYWLNKYLEENDDVTIIKIKKLLEIASTNINEAFIMLDTLVSR
jgi:hypothetical protein